MNTVSDASLATLGKPVSDADRKVVHSLDYLCLFSADLFIALVAELLNRRTPAYHSLLAH